MSRSSPPRPRSAGGSRSQAPRRRGAPRPTARGLAIRALVDMDRTGRANVVLPRLMRDCQLSDRDRAFVTELVYGTVRMRRACDWLADRHVRRSLDADVRAAVRIGTYQLAFLHTPAHAAVSATVAEVDGRARGLVNAVLRRVADDVARGPINWPNLATELSYPDWIVAQLEEDLGAEAGRAALEQMNQPAAMTIRPDGYVQDLGSQWVASAVGAGPAELVADLCAAPGGKATAMASGGLSRETAPIEALSRDKPPGATPVGDGRPALVVAGDIELARAQVLAGNVSDLALANVAPVVADAVRPAFRPGVFDRVLVDAPCSGLGVLRRRPDARWRIQPDDVPRLAGLQRRLIEAALPLLRPGGLLVYSVCTLTTVETADIDRWLATARPELQPVLPELDPAWQRVGRGARLLPQSAGTDGMFVLALRVP